MLKSSVMTETATTSTVSTSDVVLKPFKLSSELILKNRIVMAPCTRQRSELDYTPAESAIAHYSSRAAAGLIITEGALINAEARVGFGIPGIYAEPHIRRWGQIADAVHENDGSIFMQIWHMGRCAHSFYSGTTTLAPSAIFGEERRHGERYFVFYNETPVEMTDADVTRTIKDFRTAAANARRAGFDGIELHGANGYLIDQFMHQHTNRRTDQWGGSAEKRARFLLNIVAECAAEIGAGRVGVRLSPATYMGMVRHTDGDQDTFEYALRELEKVGLAYIHTGIEDDIKYDYLKGRPSEFLRKHYNGTLIGNGGYTPASAKRAISRGKFDLISFGRAYLANPDLVQRISSRQKLKKYSSAIHNGME